jgi:amino acid adenylation domain-containing protein
LEFKLTRILICLLFALVGSKFLHSFTFEILLHISGHSKLFLIKRANLWLGDGDLTYAELDALSSRLANYLASRGVGPEVNVPVCFEKSMWTVVSALAVLKAGGSFVLLDISLPVARLKSIILQTNAKFALSSAQYRDTCNTLIDEVFVVCSTSIFGPELGRHCSSVGPHNAAYIIFTSGSTGQPKGVVIEHSQLSTSSTKSGQAMGFESRPRVLQFASYAFDACILEIMTTLIFGGTVCIPSEWERKNDLVDAMRKMEVTCALFTPSLLGNLNIENVTTLDTLILGGESIPPSLVDFWALRLRVILAYGPTECCVVCFISDASQHKPAAAEVGLPIGCRAWIVKEDNYNELAEIGSPGELLIEGPILARGYLNDVAKTNSQFIRNPTWMCRSQGGKKGARFYRTGDRARYNDNGTVCYVGRIDGQVKIRGQRLEVDEVERQLSNSFSEIGASTPEHLLVEAITPSGSNPLPILIACICCNGPESLGKVEWDDDNTPLPTTSDGEREALSSLVLKLEARLRLNLPVYAMPSFYIPLRRVPLTISGKTDRKRLRNIVSRLSLKQLATLSGIAEVIASSKEPSTWMERRLQALWGEVFGTGQSTVYTDDNFFSLGGDSALAMRLVAVSRATGLDLTLEAIFRNPNLSDLASVTKNLKNFEEQVEIPPFALLEDSSTTARLRKLASEQCSITESLIEDIFPCSATQSGLLAISMKDPGAYVMQLVYELPSSLDERRFIDAWEAVAARNPILRTRFFDSSTSLLQVVVKETLHWEIVKDEILDPLLLKEKSRRMSLGERMSWHTLLHNSSSGEYHLIWTVQHSLVDGFSASKLASEVEEEYFGHVVQPRGQNFNSFIQYVSNQPAEIQERFWRDQLAGAQGPSFPRLPSSYVPHAGAFLEHQVPIFKRPGITTATIVQAAWSLLVGMYSNTSDIVTGVTLNGRTTHIPGIEKITGPTITTVPFRTRWEPDQPSIDLLQTVQNQYLSIIPHEQFGLQNIKRLSTDANTACNFGTILVVQSYDAAESSRKLLRGRKYTFSSLDCALMMECELGRDIIRFRATFDDKVLRNSQVQRIFKQFEHLLHGLSSSEASTKVSDVQRICEADTQQILAWNNAFPPKVYEALVHDLFKKRVETQPDAPAICAWDGDLTYNKLDEYSSRLASYLQTHHNIGPESLVGICFEKSVWVVISTVAVLKAGGAFVPMDPKNPTGRLQTIMESLGDNSARLILTSNSHADRLKAIGASVLTVGPSQFSSLFTGVSLHPSPVRPSNAAVVVFTSGSTGNPKGIVIEHTSLCSSILEHGSFIRLNDQSRVLQFAAHTFDISIGDIFATLIYGGCVCIPSEHDKMNNLSGAIQTLKANHVSLTATVAGYLQPEDVPGLKVLVVAGEPMTRKVMKIWAERVNLINMYGPAECTIYCIGKAEIKREDQCSDIGKGVGARVWIADPDSNNLMPIGALGELLIEGPTVARGYVDPEQTKSSFIDHPVFGKIYKTGDLAYYGHDGSIEFVGRNDGQIKLRGQRLEISEVECQLRECFRGSVEVAASVAAPNNGEKVLAAFLGVEDTRGKSTDVTIIQSQIGLARFQSLVVGLESKLHSILPSYMVPSVYIPISRIPLSASGKVDRKLLQNLASNLSFDQLSSFRGTEMRQSTPPSTRIEQRLHNLWAALLNTDRIGVEDSFFRLGGDSMTAMRLVSLARKDGIAITVSQVFKNPILSEMALIAREEHAQKITEIAPFAFLGGLDVEYLIREAVSQCRVRPNRVEDLLPSLSTQEAYITANNHKLPGDLKEAQCQIVFSLPKTLHLKKFRAAWKALYHSIPMLRTRLIQTPSGIFQAIINEPAKWHKAKSLERYLRQDRLRYIGFGDRLCNLCIVEASPEDRYFVWSANHAAYDGWMLGRLFKQLESTYLDGYSNLGNLRPASFIKYVRDCDRVAAANFWASHLRGAVSKTLCVVPDNYGFLNVTEKEKTFSLPKLQSDSTLSTLIYVAWALVISHAVNSNDIVINITNSGRDAPFPEIEDIMAPTNCVTPLRIPIDSQQQTNELLHLLHEFKIASMPFQQMGYKEIKEISPEIKALLDPTIHINVLPFMDKDELGGELGLKVVDSWHYWSCPFWIACMPKDGEMTVVIMSVDGIISDEKVRGLICQFQCALEQLMGAHLVEGEPQRLGDINIEGAGEDHCGF